MGVVRIDNVLHQEIREWISENGHKYTHPNVSSFVNKAVFDLLARLKEKNGV